jgi:hypothetical protein
VSNGKTFNHVRYGSKDCMRWMDGSKFDHDYMRIDRRIGDKV